MGGMENPDTRNQEYRDSKAEELREVRANKGRVEAIEFLGSIQATPEYIQARLEHKNKLAEMSNEKMAGELMATAEAQAVAFMKKITLSIAEALGGLPDGKLQEGLYEAQSEIQSLKFLETTKEGVMEMEERGVDRNEVLKHIDEMIAERIAEFNVLADKWSETNNTSTITRVKDIVSALESWFDWVRDMIKDRKMDHLSEERETKGRELGVLRWLKERTDKDDELKISVYIERLEHIYKRLIKDNLVEDDK